MPPRRLKYITVDESGERVAETEEQRDQRVLDEWNARLARYNEGKVATQRDLIAARLYAARAGQNEEWFLDRGEDAMAAYNIARLVVVARTRAEAIDKCNLLYDCIVGEGAFGLVYRVYDMKSGAVRCVKLLASKVEAREELKTLALLAANPFVVRADFARGVVELPHPGDSGARFGIVLELLAAGVMDFVDSASASAFLAPALNVRMVLTMLAVAADLHAANRAHCDLKPHNVLTDGSGDMKVIDFGSVTAFNEDATSVTQFFAGTAKANASAALDLTCIARSALIGSIPGVVALKSIGSGGFSEDEALGLMVSLSEANQEAAKVGLYLMKVLNQHHSASAALQFILEDTNLAEFSSEFARFRARRSIPLAPLSHMESSGALDRSPTVPSAPLTVRAVSGPAGTTVNWATAGDGGAPLTEHHIVVVELGATVSAPAEANELVVPAALLAAGASYSFQVAAVNGRGRSAWSAASAPVRVPTAPGAPTAVGAVAGNANAEVQWTAPIELGWPALSHYMIREASGTVAAVRVVAAAAAAGVVTANVTGLTNRVSYAFVVDAVNAVGGTPSAPAAPVTPRAYAVRGGASVRPSLIRPQLCDRIGCTKRVFFASVLCTSAHCPHAPNSAYFCSTKCLMRAHDR